MRSLAALALGLLICGLGLYAAPAVTPMAFPDAFDGNGGTSQGIALFVMLSIVQVFTMFGGWVTARMVADHRAGHALLVGTSALAVAIAVDAVRWSSAPVWFHIVSWTLMPVSAAIGAAAWERSLRRKGGVQRQRVAST